MYIKGTNVLVVNPRDIKQLMDPFYKHPISVITGVNTLFNAVIHHKDFERIDWSELKVAVAGGMPLQKSTSNDWFAVTQSRIVQGYRLSECSPVISTEPFGTEEYSGSVGPPLPQTEVAIIDKHHHELPQGEIGEISVKGPQVMSSYWHKPELNKEVFTEEGYFRTGDLGYVDEQGRIFIVGRVKELIIVSGFNVYPNDIEQVINHYPGILESACAGVDDEHSGQVVKAYIVLKKGAKVDEKELLEYCSEHLAHYKLPKHIEWRKEPLLKSNVGKILKRLI